MIKIGGSKNSDSALMAYPGIAYRENEKWRICVSGVAWQTPVVLNMRQRMMIRMLGGVMQASPEDLSGDVFQSRIMPFMAEADNRKSLIVTIGTQTYRLKKRTKRNGHFVDWLTIPDSVIENSAQEINGQRAVPFKVAIEGLETTASDGQIFLYQANGTSIVSDIDDTIKDSSVGDRRELLANTFLREFRSVDGMSELYQQWAKLGAGFHYVSSSPWQLFESLTSLNCNLGFPYGTMHLRNFRLRDQLLKRVSLRRHGKTVAILKLLKHMPDRKFILIGDSGEKDPKIYQKVCRKHPDRIKAILIRDLPHRPIEGDRLKKLQNSLPNGICQKFSNASQLAELTSKLF